MKMNKKFLFPSIMERSSDFNKKSGTSHQLKK
ncbi:hypothetical protein MGA3_10700 [Bacillus methanolicus MGA3]|nr:hypothetical protein MGA3_10700 [Bacillus methanolicus MGA3]